MNKMVFTILILGFLGFSGQLIHAKGKSIVTTTQEEENKEAVFSQNSSKTFPTAENFYYSEKNTKTFTVYRGEQYTEFENASKNVKEKILYKNLEKTVKSKLGSSISETVYNQPSIHIDPNRQVYFFATVNDKKETLEYDFVLLDAETKSMIWAGKKYKVKRD